MVRRDGVGIRSHRQLIVLSLLIAALVAVIALAFILYSENWSATSTGATKRALVADSLMLDYPNPELIDYIVKVLRDAGYEVDVVLGSDVNMTLYSELTRYSLIILRVHGGKAVYRTPEGKLHKINGLFTGVRWSDEYAELKKQWIATRAFPYNSTKAYLAVLPRFFDLYLKGKFPPNSVMIVASCFSLYTRDIADALARKGLHIFIGWRGAVTLSYMDRALKLLVEKAVKEGLSWREAVEAVNKELGPDPLYNERLEIVIYGQSG